MSTRFTSHCWSVAITIAVSVILPSPSHGEALESLPSIVNLLLDESISGGNSDELLIGQLSIEGEALDIAISGDYVYLAMGVEGMAVVDISNPSEPTLETSFTEEHVFSIEVSANRIAYHNTNGAESDGGSSDNDLQFLDISDPSSPMQVGSSIPSEGAFGGPDRLAGFFEDTVYLITPVLIGNTPMRRIDISDINNPVALGGIGGLDVFGISSNDGLLLISNQLTNDLVGSLAIFGDAPSTELSAFSTEPFITFDSYNSGDAAYVSTVLTSPDFLGRVIAVIDITDTSDISFETALTSPQDGFLVGVHMAGSGDRLFVSSIGDFHSDSFVTVDTSTRLSPSYLGDPVKLLAGTIREMVSKDELLFVAAAEGDLQIFRAPTR